MSKETIYREDAIKAIDIRVPSAYYAQMAINAICSVPSADRPQGEWIKHEAKSEITGLGIDFYPTEYECSCCGLKEQMYFINSKPHNFCPNCGAKMDGERKESEK